MEQETNSDIDTTMLASKAFYDILSRIQSSNLNFQLQISPFAALISLKKTLVKDKSGTYLLPPSTMPIVRDDDFENLVARNLKLEKDILDLKKNYEKAYESLQNSEAENELLKKAINDKDVMLENIKRSCKHLYQHLDQHINYH